MLTLTSRELARSAALFHALSDATRLRIVARLSTGERCVCELTDALDAAQSRLSFHLKVLMDAGLVSDRREGRWAYYRLNADVFEELRAVVSGLADAATEAGSAACC